jgi:hypothetical protein
VIGAIVGGWPASLGVAFSLPVGQRTLARPYVSATVGLPKRASS